MILPRLLATSLLASSLLQSLPIPWCLLSREPGWPAKYPPPRKRCSRPHSGSLCFGSLFCCSLLQLGVSSSRLQGASFLLLPNIPAQTAKALPPTPAWLPEQTHASVQERPLSPAQLPAQAYASFCTLDKSQWTHSWELVWHTRCCPARKCIHPSVSWLIEVSLPVLPFHTPA